MRVAYRASGASRDIYNSFTAPLTSNPAGDIAQATVPLKVVVINHHFLVGKHDEAGPFAFPK
jgi:hypothetical protein